MELLAAISRSDQDDIDRWYELFGDCYKFSIESLSNEMKIEKILRT